MDIDELKRLVRAGETPKFLLFWGHSADPAGSVTESCLSQWYPSPFEVDSVRYPTAEHWMMAHKALLFDDPEMLAEILAAKSPAQAKKLGGKVRGFDEARWRERRFDIVSTGNVHKFRQNLALGDFLRATGTRVLVEASPVDRIWGIGLARDAAEAQDPLRWRGLNLLGFALMHARAQL